jgi:curved DNA-binding protein CbpA
MRWAAVAPRLDYFAILRLPRQPPPNDAQLRAAYRVFSRAFHPDQYRGARVEVREAASRVFAIGATAYRVLSEPLLRLRYQRVLASGVPQVPVEDLERAVRADTLRAHRSPAATLATTPAGREAAARADQLTTMGELQYAKRALEEAAALEPENLALAAKLEAISAQLFAPRGRRR